MGNLCSDIELAYPAIDEDDYSPDQ